MTAVFPGCSTHVDVSHTARPAPPPAHSTDTSVLGELSFCQSGLLHAGRPKEGAHEWCVLIFQPVVSLTSPIHTSAVRGRREHISCEGTLFRHHRSGPGTCSHVHTPMPSIWPPFAPVANGGQGDGFHFAHSRGWAPTTRSCAMSAAPRHTHACFTSRMFALSTMGPACLLRPKRVCQTDGRELPVAPHLHHRDGRGGREVARARPSRDGSRWRPTPRGGSRGAAAPSAGGAGAHGRRGVRQPPARSPGRRPDVSETASSLRHKPTP